MNSRLNAMLLHMIDGRGTSIPAETIDRAGTLVKEFLLPTARDVFAVGPALQRTQDIAGWILVGNLARILASDVKTSVWNCRNLSTKELNDVLDPLVTGGWLTPEKDFPTNLAWVVTQGLREHFANRTRQERERRTEVRALIQSIGRQRRESKE